MPASRSLRIIFTVFLAVLFVLLFAAPSAAQKKDGSALAPSVPAAAKAKVAANYGHIPLSFEANRGQTDSSVQFLSRGQGYTLFLRPGEAVLALRSAKISPPKSPLTANLGDPRHPFGPKPEEIETSFVRMKLVGANPRASVHEEDEQITKTNYFIGNDPAKWRTNVPNYGRVRYAGIYPGIDLVYYGNQSRLEHDFVVSPGNDPSRIRLSLTGAKQMRIDPTTGDLIASTGRGEVRLLKPASYQESNGRRARVSSTYTLLPRNQVGFSVVSYNRAQPLVIDPVLVYSTFLGGSGNKYGSDWGAGIAVDASGNAYIVGRTYSSDFPIENPIQGKLASDWGNAFVTKLNSDGTALAYSTFLGGSGGDAAMAVAVDVKGNAYVTGWTQSADFPTVNPIKATLGRADENAFVAKLNAAGSALVYSTYLGGSGIDSGSAISLDGAGDAFIAGETQSSDFPTVNAFQGTLKCPSGGNAFLAKMAADGSSLIYSTYLGGTGAPSYGATRGDYAMAVAVDANGEAYVTGGASSTDFPILNALQSVNKTTFGRGTVFISEFNASGSALVYSTYLGGSMFDQGNAIAVDASGNAYVVGLTGSADFPTVNAYQSKLFVKPCYPCGDTTSGFLSKIQAGGSSLVYSTFLGATVPSTTYDSIGGIAIDANDSAIVAGTTTSPSFPVTADALYPSSNEYWWGFLSKFSPDGTELDYSTFITGKEDAWCPGVCYRTGAGPVAVDSYGAVYLTGSTNDGTFPVTPNAFQSTMSQNGDAFIAKFDIPATLPTAVTLTACSPAQVPNYPVSFTAGVSLVKGGAIQNGSINFMVNGAVAATVPLDATGHASYSTSSLPLGWQTVQADYLGTATYKIGFSNTIAEDISIPYLKALTGAKQQGPYGSPLPHPLTVQISDLNGNSIAFPGLGVTFSGAGLSFSSTTATTDANGHAQVTATPLQVGYLNATATIANGSNSTSTAVFSLRGRQAPLGVHVSYPQFPGTMLRYGDAIPAPTAYYITGFVNGDTAVTAVTGAPEMWTTATSTSPPGKYPIYISKGTLASAKYLFWLYDSAVLIYRANLTLIVNSYTIQQGQPIPTLGYTIAGFVNGDTQAVVTGAPTLYTPATSTSPPGVYPIEAGLGSLSALPNYQFSWNRITYGTLTILANTDSSKTTSHPASR
jgi:hypothetical protein